MVQALAYEPSGDMIETNYLTNEQTAYIEMNQISGMSVAKELNPLNNSTYGLGLTLKDAISRGMKKIILGIGGSATNDGGAGMLQALGCDFYGEDGFLITDHMNGQLIGQVSKIDTWELDQTMSGIQLIVACDVKNPLLGRTGCSYVYAKQKGARDEDINILEKNMTHYRDILTKHYHEDLSETPGAGAAGGVGYGALMMLKASLISGIHLIKDLAHLEEKMMDSDLIIVGEGQLDVQSDFGKAPIEIAKLAKEKHKKVIGIFGQSDIKEHPSIDDIYTIVPNYADLKSSMKDPKPYIRKILEQIK